jgi:putative transposase
MKERGHARTSEETAVHAQTARQRGQSSHHGDARAARTAEHRLASQVKFLIRDRAATFTTMFDAVFTAERITTLPTPVPAPRTNSYAERWVGTPRRERLDRMLILHRRQLQAALTEYLDHKNPSPTSPGTQPRRTPTSAAPSQPTATSRSDDVIDLVA